MLELVISVTILALILGVIYGAMRLGRRAWEVEAKRVDRLQRMRVTYDIISEDIKSIISPKRRVARVNNYGSKFICPNGRGCGLKAPLFIGEQSRMKFISTNTGLDRRLSKSRYRVVSYYLGQEYDSEYKGVVMEESTWLFPDFFRFETLCDMCDSEDEELEYDTYIHSVYPDVTELTFRYYGVHNGEEEPDWYEKWNSIEDLCSCDQGQIENLLPEKIEVRMVRPSITSQEDNEELEEVRFEVYIESNEGA